MFALGPGEYPGRLGLGRGTQRQACLISQGAEYHGQLPGGEAREVDDGPEAGGEGRAAVQQAPQRCRLPGQDHGELVSSLVAVLR